MNASARPAVLKMISASKLAVILTLSLLTVTVTGTTAGHTDSELIDRAWGANDRATGGRRLDAEYKIVEEKNRWYDPRAWMAGWARTFQGHKTAKNIWAVIIVLTAIMSIIIGVVHMTTAMGTSFKPLFFVSLSLCFVSGLCYWGVDYRMKVWKVDVEANKQTGCKGATYSGWVYFFITGAVLLMLIAMGLMSSPDQYMGNENVWEIGRNFFISGSAFFACSFGLLIYLQFWGNKTDGSLLDLLQKRDNHMSYSGVNIEDGNRVPQECQQPTMKALEQSIKQENDSLSKEHPNVEFARGASSF